MSFSTSLMFNHDVVIFINLWYNVLYDDFLTVSYIVKMVVIPLHSLHICTHQNHVVWSVSRYGAHKPIGFHAPFAIRCCSGTAIVDFDACIYYPHICTWLIYVMAINLFWIWFFLNFEFESNASVLKMGSLGAKMYVNVSNWTTHPCFYWFTTKSLVDLKKVIFALKVRVVF